MDLDARQPQHASQRLLQGLREGPGAAVQLARFDRSRGSLELDGRAAQGGQRAAGDLAQRQSVRRPHVSARRRQQGPADRRRVGAVARSQRAADRDQADQGPVGNPSRALAQRRVRQLRDPELSAGRPDGRTPTIPGSFVRQAFKNGLAMQDDAGLQPLQVRASSADRIRTTPACPIARINFFGGHGLNDGNIKERMSRPRVRRPRRAL